MRTKTTFFDNLRDEFCKLNIERFYKLNTPQTFVSHLIIKEGILKLIKCIINARVEKSNKESYLIMCHNSAREWK